VSAIRSYSSDDDPSIVAFFARCHRDDPEIPEVAADWWRGFVAMSFNQGGRDFTLIEAGGAVVALLVSHPLEEPVRHLRILVHPDHRRRGLATRLLRWVIHRDRRPGLALQTNCPESWSAAHAFYERHGFERVHLELEMRLPLAPRAEPPGAAGPRVALNEDDRHDAALAALHNRAYRGTRGFTPMDADSLAAARRLPGSCYLVVEVADGLAGFVQVVDERDGQGCIESLVVADDHRRCGLGRALLEHGLHLLARRGCTEAILRVDARNRPALTLYESVGFERFAATAGFRGSAAAVTAALR
jgi:mycothiol synthase